MDSVIAPGSTATMAAAARDTHTESVRIFQEYNGVEKALKQQLRKAIDESYLLAIHDRTCSNTLLVSGTVHSIGDISEGKLISSLSFSLRLMILLQRENGLVS